MTVKAYILGKITPKTEDTVKEQIKAIEGVKVFDLCFGKYDFILICEATDMTTLENSVIDNIRNNENIESTETLIVASVETDETQEEPVEAGADETT